VASQDSKQIQLLANHFKISFEPGIFYQYRVDFEPEVESKGKKRALLDSINEIWGRRYIFDGTMLWSTKNFKDCGVDTVDRDNNPFHVALTFTKEVPVGGPDDKTDVQIYNILFRRNLRHLKMIQIRRNHYSKDLARVFPQDHIELWPGFITPINLHDRGHSITIDRTWKTLRTDTVWDKMNEMYNNFQTDEAWHNAVAADLTGAIVLTRYNNRTYPVHGVDWNQNPASLFPRNGRQTSFADYYLDQYKIDIRVQIQPLLINRQRRRLPQGGFKEDVIFLIPELCYRTGITDEMRANDDLMKRMATITLGPPQERVMEIVKFAEEIASKNEEIKADFAHFGLTLNSKPPMVPARQLPRPAVMITPRRQPVIDYYDQQRNDLDWIKQLRSKDLCSAAPLTSWAVIYPNRDEQRVDRFLGAIHQFGRPLGIQIVEPAWFPIRGIGGPDYENALREAAKTKPALIVVILPDKTKGRYDRVKSLCMAELGVTSQCFVARNLGPPDRGPNPSIMTKLLLQMDAKLGATLWTMELGAAIKEIMIVGVDVCHPSGLRGNSVAGFVASMDNNVTQYFSQVCIQQTGQELVDKLADCMHNALRAYQQANGKLPKRIVVYRDGVGDGQLRSVVDVEVPQVTKVFHIFGEAYKPVVCYVIVKKRINTRLFAVDPANNRNLLNPMSGALVDSMITHRGWYDFFLISQMVKQGTVSPTHYHVVYDTATTPPNILQELTYKLCHLYYNQTGPIRVPAPCMYAHKLAFLIGQNVKALPKASLNTTLQYL